MSKNCEQKRAEKSDNATRCFCDILHTSLLINNLMQTDEMLYDSLDEDVSRVKARVDDSILMVVGAQIRRFIFRVWQLKFVYIAQKTYNTTVH